MKSFESSEPVAFQTLSLLVSANDAARVQFAHYYDRLIIPLKHLIKDPPRDRSVLLFFIHYFE